MKRTITTLILLGLILLGCKSSSSNTSNSLQLTFETKSNSGVTGTATFIQKNNEVTLVAKLAGLNLENTPYTFMKKPIVLPQTQHQQVDIGTQPSRNTEDGAIQNATKAT